MAFVLRVARNRLSSLACPVHADIKARASIAIIAGAPIGLPRRGTATGCRITHARNVALIGCIAGGLARADATALDTEVRRGAGVPVVAARAVGLDRRRASAGLRIARAGLMALRLGHTLDRVKPGTGTAHAPVAPSAGVFIIAGNAIETRRTGAGTRFGVADAHVACVRLR